MHVWNMTLHSLPSPHSSQAKWVQSTLS